MLVLNSEQIRALVPMSRLIDGLEEAFRAHHYAPPRQVLKMPGGSGERQFLSMPVFDDEGGAVVKLVTYIPDNPANGLPSIQAALVVFSREGTPVAILDGTTVTQLRTGAASGLASRYLSRAECKHLVILGTGALAPAMALAHCSVRPIDQVTVWGRHRDRASASVEKIRTFVNRSVRLIVAESLEEAVRTADIVSCATRSTQPVLQGKWLKAGTFVDLVGSFSPSAREADDDVILQSRIFVDTYEGAFSEAGDLLDPIGRGLIGRECIEADLASLVSGSAPGRRTADEITLFKSVGTAIEDLAAARLVLAAANND